MTVSIMCGCRNFHEIRFYRTPYAIHEETEEKEMVDENYKAGRMLLANIRKPLAANEPILIASFVDINDLDTSSTFGRLTAEQIASRLVQGGFQVIEMKLRSDSVWVQEQSGEFLLSRELSEVKSQWKASAVVVGTYAVAQDEVFISAKLVDVRDNSILSAYDYSLPIGWNIRQLLNETTAGAKEQALHSNRIPLPPPSAAEEN